MQLAAVVSQFFLQKLLDYVLERVESMSQKETQVCTCLYI